MKKILLLAFFLITALSVSVSAFASEAMPTDTNTETTSELSEAFMLITDNSDKIFSVLAFISSLIVVFAYKRGLIPLINKGLTAIKKSTDNFESKAQDSLLKTENSISFLLDKFACCENTIERVSTNLEELTEKLGSLENESNERALLKTVILSQIDMLYEIFMQSGIPQYAKDSLGEKVAKMKKSLLVGEENDRT